MVKHKLDEEVEDILQHYGIKGMKWGTKRSGGQTSSAASNVTGGGGGGDIEETEEEKKKRIEAEKMLKLLRENTTKQKGPFNALGKKLSGISKASKEKGKQLMKSVLGEGKPTYKVVNTSKDNKMGKLKKAPNPFLEKDGSLRAEFQTKKPKKKASDYPMSQANQALLKSFTDKGWKKQEYKPKGSLKDRGYTFTTTGTTVNGKPVGKDNTAALIKKYKKKGLTKVNTK